MIGLLFVAQLAVVAHAPDTAATCVPFDITVAARASGAVAPRITPPVSTPSLQLLKSSVTTRVERDGSGQPSSISEATFQVATDGSGRVVLPTFVASAGALHGLATPAPVSVHDAGSLAPTVVVRAWLDRGDRGLDDDTLFVGQQVDYVVDVLLNETARQRLRRNPTFFPPEMPGVLAYDLAPPTAVSRVGRRCFETLSYRRALFPLFAGRAAIAPAALTYSLPLSTSFFSREESFELRTDSVRFVAADVPVDGRPADFAGAVGALEASSSLSVQQARMGDPVVLTLRVEGAGNVKLWPRPALSLPWASVSDGGERVEVDTSKARVRGAKEFDWLLTPKKAGRQEIPAIGYPYFEADRRVYAEARTQPLALDVAQATLAAIDSTPVTRLGVRHALREELPRSVPSRPWFWLLLAVAPAPAALRRAFGLRKRKSRQVSPLKAIRVAAQSRSAYTPRDLRRLYLDAIQERVPNAQSSTRRELFTRALRRAGVTEATAMAASDLLTRLDEAAFSPSGSIEPAALDHAASIALAVDAEAVRPVSIGGAGRALMAALLLAGLSGTLGALPDGAKVAFQHGVESYERGDFVTSGRLFARVAARAPRAVDAWANAGTAAWSRGDSAEAVRGWQRALRLDPLDDEARDRLASVQVPSLRSRGYVPPLPVNWLALAGLGCWVAAWLLLFVPPARRPANARAIAGGGLVIGVALLAAALEVRDRLDPRGLAVLRGSRMLVDAPGSQVALASGVVGETGLLGAREGAWVRITLDGARAGWVPVASVLPLDAATIGD